MSKLFSMLESDVFLKIKKKQRKSAVLCSFVKLCPTLATPWTVAHQAPLSMRLSRQEYWSGLSFSPLGDLPDSRIKPKSPSSAGGFFTTELPGKPQRKVEQSKKD